MALLRLPCVLFVLLFVGCALVKGSNIIKGPDAIAVRKGDNFNLTCIANIDKNSEEGIYIKGEDKYIFKSYPKNWTQGNFNEAKYKLYHTSKDLTEQTYTIEVKDAQPSDADIYACGLVKNINGNVTKNTAVVIGDPDIQSIGLQMSEDLVVKCSSNFTIPVNNLPVPKNEGHSVFFECQDQNANKKCPNMTIFVGETQLVSKTSYIQIGDQGSYQVIAEGKRVLQGSDDNQKLVCKVVSTEPVNTFNTSRILSVPRPVSEPIIDPDEEQYNVGESIYCSADGNPTPTIEWVSEDGQHRVHLNKLKIVKDMVCDVDEYKRMLRIDAPTFHYILDAIRTRISKKLTRLRRPLYPDERLSLTLTLRPTTLRQGKESFWKCIASNNPSGTVVVKNRAVHFKAVDPYAPSPAVIALSTTLAVVVFAVVAGIVVAANWEKIGSMCGNGSSADTGTNEGMGLVSTRGSR